MNREDVVYKMQEMGLEAVKVFRSDVSTVVRLDDEICFGLYDDKLRGDGSLILCVLSKPVNCDPDHTFFYPSQLQIDFRWPRGLAVKTDQDGLCNVLRELEKEALQLSRYDVSRLHNLEDSVDVFSSDKLLDLLKCVKMCVTL